MSPLCSQPFRIRDIVRIDQRYRRAGGDLVVAVRQIHRSDGTVEVTCPAWARAFLPDYPREITFTDLRDNYDLLVSLKGART